MAKITYQDKEEAPDRNNPAENEVFWPRDANEIKESVNELYDTLGSIIDPATEKIDNSLIDMEGVKEAVGGVKSFAVGANILPQLGTINFADSTIWATGFLTNTGAVSNENDNPPDWYYTRGYHKVYPGTYTLNSLVFGSASIIVYNSDLTPILSINDNGVWDENVPYPVTLPATAKYIRISKKAGRITGVQLLPTVTINVVNEKPFINNEGANEILINTLKKRNPPKGRFPIVSFISDDGHSDNDVWYTGVLTAKNIKSSFAIITNNMVGTPANVLTRARVTELYNAGHDIISHTVNHSNLTALTTAQAEAQLRNSKLKLMEMGITNPLFVAPFGSRNAAVDILIRKYYPCHFVTGFDNQINSRTSSNKTPLNTYFINRFHFDVNSNGDSSTNGTLKIDTLKAAVDIALEKNEWLVFQVHPHFNEYSATANAAGYAARRAELSTLIDYIQSLSIPILTAKQAFEIYQSPVNIGNEGIDSKWYSLGIDGVEGGTYFY